MYLCYLPANQAYVFTMSDRKQMVRLYDGPMLFNTRAEAIEQAKRVGLRVLKDGSLEVMDPEERRAEAGPVNFCPACG